MILAIDDCRDCIGADIVIRNPITAKWFLGQHAKNVTQLWLDHDLGEDGERRPWDIRGVVDWIDEHPESFRPDLKVLIMTSNPVGRQYIRAALGKHFSVFDDLYSLAHSGSDLKR